MKTILLTINFWNGVGGVERVIVNLANTLVKRGFRVIILSLFPDRILTTQYALDERVEKHFLAAVDTRSFSFWKALLAKIKVFFALRKFIQQHQIDFVIKNEFFIPPLFFRLNRLTTCNLFHSCYDYFSFTLRKRINLWGANYNVILSSKELARWQRIFAHIVVIPNMFTPLKQVHDIKKSNKVIAIGHLIANKGFERLIRCYLPLTEKFPNWQLVIIGAGEDEKKLQTLISKNGVEQQIMIQPPTNNIEEQYAASSICVLSSYLEGFPMILVEAMSFGVPCVAFDITTGPNDIIQDGHNGLLVPNGDEVAMTHALARLMNDLQLRQTMGQQARLSVERFSEDAIINKWLQLINPKIDE
jgi:glycosyltransferase involved in cell wall biosynthesis